MDNTVGPVGNTLWLIVEKLAFMTVSLVVSLLMARHLQPAGFGELSFLLAAVSLLAPIMALGLNSLIARELLRRSDDHASIIGTAVTLRLISGLLVAGITGLTSILWLPSEQRVLFSLLAFASVANAMLVVDFWLQAKSANYYAVVVRLSVLVIVSSGRVAAVWLDAGLEVFIYIACMEWVLSGMFYALAYRTLGGPLRQLRATLAEGRHLVRDARWLWFTAMSAVLTLKVDQLMLGIILDERAVGVYAAAVRLSEVWYVLPAAIVTGFFPQLVTVKEANPKAYWRSLQQLNDVLFVSAIAIAVLVTALAAWLVPFLYGLSYTAAADILVLHVWAGVFVFTSSLLNRWLIIEGSLRLALGVQVAGATTNILLNIWLIPKYGAFGAALATLVSASVSGYFVLFFHQKLRPMARLMSGSFTIPFRLMKRIYQRS